MKKICAVSGKEFEVTSDNVAFYEKMGVPVPTLCPEERNRRRLLFRNERKLYWRTCDATGKKTLSIYSPDKDYVVYDPKYWFSDKWDAKDYGRDFNLERPFFEQFHELWKVVPRMAIVTAGNKNADYVNYAGWNKGCYLIFDSDHNHDCAFLVHAFWNKNCLDCFYTSRGELCYECMTSFDCYDCRFCQDCKNCAESWFLKSCIGCTNCFGCVNLRNKQYWFLNKQCTKSEYEKKLKDLNLHQYSGLKNMRKQFGQFLKTFPQKYYQGVQNEEVLGDYIDNSKNAQHCFNIEACRDCKYLIDCHKCKDCYDIDEWGGTGAELCYEGHVVGEGAQNIKFCSNVWESVHDITYSEMCIKGSHDLFGCTGLQHAEYCILNKQYSKEEYEKLRDDIIKHMKKTGEWGEFFSIELSPFTYNETVAQEYYPLTKTEALKQGYRWKDEELKDHKPTTLKDIPDSITDISNNIVDEVLACECCKKNYQIQKEELRFYKKMELPLPRKCPDCRHADRMGLKNPRILHTRKCDKCSVEIQTTFAPDRPEKVYCEGCYLSFVE